MEYEQIKKIMDDMGESKLSSLEIAFPDGTKISLKKEEKVIVKKDNVDVETLKKVEIKEENISKNEDKKSGNIVKSPMVGTFYIKPSPTSVPYVEVGKNVKKGDVLCIVEAMKLMNEIESDFDGKIVEILVKDGTPVEYGTELFIIQ